MAETLDFPKIMKNVSDKHSKFLESYGNQSEKVIADGRLRTERLSAKISLILHYFSEIKIIDQSKRQDEGGYTKISLYKHGNGNFIEIWIDTDKIVLTRNNFWIQSGCMDQEIPGKRFYNIDDDFDWIYFSEFLLDYIHEVIYSRREAGEQKLKNILGDIHE